MRVWFLLLLLWAGPACAAPCDTYGGSEMVRAELLFGRSQPGGLVSADDWADFLAKSVTPRFPDGLTALDGQGQWLDSKAAVITHEPSTVLLILAPAAADLKARLDAVRDEYKSRFHQQSVGLVTGTACADF
jgi:hypothetical protein